MTTADPGNAPFVGSFAGTSDDLWALAGSEVLHWDGAAWERWPRFGVELSDLAMDPSGAVFVTGMADAVLRRAP